jgi:AhpC/TSA family
MVTATQNTFSWPVWWLMLVVMVQAQQVHRPGVRAENPLAKGGITVLIFVRSDCPISNRYAPEIQRLAEEFNGAARFWLVYPDKKETEDSVRKHIAAYGYKLATARDTSHELVRKSHARITPEAAVFSGTRLLYVGRIDDRAVDFNAFRPKAGHHDLEDAIRAVVDGKPVPKPSGNAVGCYISDLQ